VSFEKRQGHFIQPPGAHHSRFSVSHKIICYPFLKSQQTSVFDGFFINFNCCALRVIANEFTSKIEQFERFFGRKAL
jgi:hypothetical protein